MNVTGIWLRTIGDELHVSAEVNGAWVRVITERNHGSISHIVEETGIKSAPLDDVQDGVFG